MNYKLMVRAVVFGLFLSSTVLLLNINKASALVANNMPISNTLGQPIVDNLLMQSGNMIASESNGGPGRLGYNNPTDMVVSNKLQKMFVVDSSNSRVLVYDLDSSLQFVDELPDLVIGQKDFYSISNTVNSQTLSSPSSVGIDEASNILAISDSGNNRVLLFDLDNGLFTGMSATYVVGQASFITNQSATSATGLNNPTGVHIESASGTAKLLVADTNNNRILVYNLPNTVVNGLSADLVLGQSSFTSNISGAGPSNFNHPHDVLVDNDYLYVVDSNNNRVMLFGGQLSIGQAATKVLGQPNMSSTLSATASNRMNNPLYVGKSTKKNALFVSDSGNNRVLMFNSSSYQNGQHASAVIGQSSFSALTTAPTSSANMKLPNSVYINDLADIMLVADTINNRLLQYDLSLISTGLSAENILGQYSLNSSILDDNASKNDPNNGPNSYGLANPSSVVLDESDHRLFISDTDNNRILIHSLDNSNQLIDQIADFVLGQSNFDDNSPGLSAGKLNQPTKLAFDSTGNRLFVSDSNNNRVLVFDTSVLTNGQSATNVIGQANFTTAVTGLSSQSMNRPEGLFYDLITNRLFVGDFVNNRVLVFSNTGTINPVADYVIGQNDFTTNNCTITIKSVCTPSAITVTNTQVFVADYSNNRVMVFGSNIATNNLDAVAVLGSASYNSAGYINVTSASTNQPSGLSVSGSSLLVSQNSSHRLSIFDINQIINGENAIAIVGQSDATSSSAMSGEFGLSHPSSTAVDSVSGQIYITDSGNNRLAIYNPQRVVSGKTYQADGITPAAGISLKAVVAGVGTGLTTTSDSNGDYSIDLSSYTSVVDNSVLTIVSTSPTYLSATNIKFRLNKSYQNIDLVQNNLTVSGNSQMTATEIASTNSLGDTDLTRLFFSEPFLTQNDINLMVSNGSSLTMDKDLLVLGAVNNYGQLSSISNTIKLTIGSGISNYGIINFAGQIILDNSNYNSASAHTIIGNPVHVGTFELVDLINNSTSSELLLSSDLYISQMLTLDGLDADDLVSLQSSSSGNLRNIVMTGNALIAADYTSIKDNAVKDYSNSVSLPINPINSLNIGNTTGWFDSAVVTSVASSVPDGQYHVGQTITINVNYDQNVVVTGSPRLKLNLTGPKYANYVSGSGTSTLSFDYTVGSEDKISELNYESINALELNGATITSNSTNTLNILPPVGGSNSLSGSSSIELQMTAIVVTESDGINYAYENGSSDTVLVKLSSAPSSNVVLTVISDNPSITTSVGLLIFTPINWNDNQIVTLSANNDSNAYDEDVNVSFAVNDTSTTNHYQQALDKNISVIADDDDEVGIEIMNTLPISISENNTSMVLDVKLKSQPLGNVQLNILSSDVSSLSVSSNALDFSTSNWSTVQQITIQSIDNLVDQDKIVNLYFNVNDSLSSIDYSGMDQFELPIELVDNDTAGLDVVETSSSTIVDESNSSDTLSVRLTSRPLGSVNVSVIIDDNSELVTVPESINFTPNNWQVYQNILVFGVDDQIVDGDIMSNIQLSISPSSTDEVYASLQNYQVTVNNQDNDSAGIIITESDGTTSTTENGTQDTYEIKLSSKPFNGGSSVVVTIVATDQTIIDNLALGVNRDLSFNDTNWNIPQLVTIQANDDAIVDGMHIDTIMHRVNTSLTTDTDYLSIYNLPSVNNTITDNESAALIINHNDSNTVLNEAATGDSITLKLSNKPVSNVVVDMTSSPSVQFSSSQLVFTPDNWNNDQTISVTALSDQNIVSENITITASVNTALSSDLWQSVSAVTLNATINDDDIASIQAPSSVVISENSTSGIFVSLNSQPSSDVVVDLVGINPANLNTSVSTLTFTTSNWSSTQFVGLIANDNSTSGSITETINLSINDSMSDNLWDSLSDYEIDVTITDNDSPGLLIVNNDGLQTSESGTTDTFDISLTSSPASPVTVTLTADSQSQLDGSGSTKSINFSPGNWNNPRTITVSAIDDIVAEYSLHESSISISFDSSDMNYDSLSVVNINSNIVDNDIPTLQINESSGTTIVGESGLNDSVSVNLSHQPLSDVTLKVTIGNTTLISADRSTLTFTSSNWNVPQVVNISAIDNDDIHTNSSRIDFAIDATNSNTQFENISSSLVLVNINDDDTPGYILSRIGSGPIIEGSSGQVEVVLSKKPQSNVVIMLGSTNPTKLISQVNSLTFTPSNWSTPRTVNVYALNDFELSNESINISASINTAYTDDAWDTLSDQNINFAINDNDLASFTVNSTNGTNQVIENTTTDTLKVKLDYQPSSNVVIDFISSNPAKLNVTSSLVFTPSNWNVGQDIVISSSEDSDIVDDSVNVTAVINDSLSDGLWSTVPNQVFNATIIDNDTANIIVTSSTNQISENNGQSDIGVRLSAQPSSTVIVNVTNDSPSELNVPVSAISFSPSNWNIPQTFTVSGIDDDFDRDDASSINFEVNQLLSDINFADTPNVVLPITLIDNDLASIIMSQSGPSTSVVEGGSSDNITVALGSKPYPDNSLVTVILTISNQLDIGAGSGQPIVLNFDDSNWNVPQIVTVSATDDSINEGAHSTFVSASINTSTTTSASYLNVNGSTTTVTITDNDTIGIIVEESSGQNLLIENGASDSMLVKLATQPQSGTIVTVDISNSNPKLDIGAGFGLSLRIQFSESNWSTGQTVSLTALNNEVMDGDMSVFMGVSVNTSLTTDTNYSSIITPINSTIQINDDERTTAQIVAIQDISENPRVTGLFLVSLGLMNTTLSSIQINYSISGTASSPIDYAPLTGYVLIPVGATSANLVVNVPRVSDTVAEGIENLSITLTTTSIDVVTIGASNMASINVLDDESDSDGDGVPDSYENLDGTDFNDIRSYKDTDNDGFADYVENFGGGVNYDDSIGPDDNDGDGTPNYVEGLQGTDKNDYTDYIDSDNDGFSDYLELVSDTDWNNASQYPISTDYDMVPDKVELMQGTSISDGADYLDTDNDGDPDFVEIIGGGHPNNASIKPLDTDSDGVPDVVEIIQGTNPNNQLDYLDSDKDGSSNYFELLNNTNPYDAVSGDTDGDGVPNSSDNDLDNDGIPNDQESAITGNPDANGDGIEDKYQDYVASAKMTGQSISVTLQAQGACRKVTSYSVVEDAKLSAKDNSAKYPIGLNDFKLKCPSSGDSATVSFIYSEKLENNKFKYRKFYPLDKTFKNISDLATISYQTVNGKEVSIVSFTLKDGDSRTDTDGLTNAVIWDPSGLSTEVLADSTLANTGAKILQFIILGFGLIATTTYLKNKISTKKVYQSTK